MIPTLNAVTAGGGLSLPDYVQLAARYGFAGVEYSIEAAAALVEQTSFEEVAAIFESNTVLPAVFGLPVEWRKDDATFEAGMERLPQLAKLAQDLDSTRCCTWVLPDGGVPAAEYAERSMRRFVRIGRVLEEQGVRLGLEFIGPAHFRSNPANVWFYDIPGALQVVAAVAELGKLENIGLLVDSFHWYTSGGTPMDLASIPTWQVVHVHVNDAPNVPREQQQDGVRLLPGASGVIDIQAFLKTLDAIGYDGPVAAETFSAELKALPADEAAARAATSMQQIFQTTGITPVRLL
ncbi:MAG TPA: sugar phosphate isomerase/epimerase family protein [Abditibacteriaceae bacterium]|jgi:sugar phosphate isomerase/epimerase